MVSGCATEEAAESAIKDSIMTAIPFQAAGIYYLLFISIIRIRTEGNYKQKHNIGCHLMHVHSCCWSVMHTISLTFKRTIWLSSDISSS